MIKEFIYNILANKRDKERHEVIKLNWKKAEIEKLLEQRKKENSMERLAELKEKLLETDNLIGSILDDEPADKVGEYGKAVAELFQDLSWIDFCCITEE